MGSGGVTLRQLLFSLVHSEFSRSKEGGRKLLYCLLLEAVMLTNLHDADSLHCTCVSVWQS